jgi:hypothetical protein
MSVPLVPAGRDLLEFSRDREDDVAPLHHRHQDLAGEEHQLARRAAHQDPPGRDPPDQASSLNNLPVSLVVQSRFHVELLSVPVE